MHNLHDRHRTGAERSGQDATLGQENHHDNQIEKKEGYSEDFSGIEHDATYPAPIKKDRDSHPLSDSRPDMHMK